MIAKSNSAYKVMLPSDREIGMCQWVLDTGGESLV
jgi:hypothetical protein